MERNEIFEEWDKTLQELFEARNQLAHINSEIPKVKDTLARLEAEVYLEVSSMKDGSGKPVYTNETQRQKATLLKLLKTDGYVQLHSVLRRYEEEKEHLIAKISNLKDRIEYFTYLVGGADA